MRMLRTHGVDIALCALAGVVLVTTMGAVSSGDRLSGAIATAALLVLLARGRHPPAASLVGFVLLVLSSHAATQLPATVFLAILASFAVAGLPPRRATAVVGWAAGCVGTLVSMIDDPGVGGASDVILTLTFCTIVWAAALAAMEWSRQASRAHVHAEMVTAARDSDIASATVHERARIAGELHDIVSHGLSIVVLQAVAARMALQDDPDAVAEADRRLGIVEGTARDALDDMRRLLDLLRTTDLGTVGDGLTPSAGLEQLPALVEQARLAGLAVRVTVDRGARILPSGLDAAAYRIVQEAMTNVIKHAPGATVQVLVRSDPRQLELCVDSTGGAEGAPVHAGAGYGLIGMRQRAQLYDGTLDAGPHDGGFLVQAHFPLGRVS